MPFLGTGEPKIGQKVRFSDFIPFSGTKKSEYLELGVGLIIFGIGLTTG